MAIALVSSLSGGGAERQVSLLLKHQVFDYVLILEDLVEYEGVDKDRVIPLSSLKPSSPVVLRYLAVPFYIWRLWRFCKMHQQDIVVSFLFRADLVNVLSRVFLRGKHVVTIRNHPIDHYRSGLRKCLGFLLKVLVYPLATHVVSNSEEAKRIIAFRLKYPVHKLSCIPNGVDVDYILEASKQSLNFDLSSFKRPLFLAMGRLQTQKGFLELLKAVKLLKAKTTQFSLLISGKGSLDNDLLQLIDKYDLKEQVYLIGFCDQPYALLSQADCFVLSSRYEGMPNVLIESLVCNVPIISTNCACGVKELLLDNCDFNELNFNSKLARILPVLESDAAIEQLAAAMADYMVSKDEYRDESKRMDCVNRYRMDLIKRQWLKFFEDICSEDGETK